MVAAPNGWLGKAIVQVFAEAAKSGDFAKLKIITSKESDVVKQAVSAAPGKVEVVVLEYQDKPALEAALKDVDVVISTMGGRGAQAANEQVVIEASEQQIIFFSPKVCD
jgi:saccharopine dehydrogenase-like NADP-dependent oxidoreductase